MFFIFQIPCVQQLGRKWRRKALISQNPRPKMARRPTAAGPGGATSNARRIQAGVGEGPRLPPKPNLSPGPGHSDLHRRGHPSRRCARRTAYFPMTVARARCHQPLRRGRGGSSAAGAEAGVASGAASACAEAENSAIGSVLVTLDIRASTSTSCAAAICAGSAIVSFSEIASLGGDERE
jgi:hypothetical protein